MFGKCSRKHPVEAQLHGDLNTYGSFCITVPLRQIIDIQETLVETNREWDRRAAEDPQSSRGLDVRRDIGFLGPSEI